MKIIYKVMFLFLFKRFIDMWCIKVQNMFNLYKLLVYNNALKLLYIYYMYVYEEINHRNSIFLIVSVLLY